MSRSLVTALGMAAALAVGSAAFAQDKALVDKGMKVYTDQKCSLCHSIAGKGNAKGSLDGVAAKLKAAEIREWLTDPKGMTAKTKAERKPAMKAYPNLPKDDLDALVAYMMTLNKK
ncbi:MAG: cytochrome c [Acidobacteria bacterium]|nr:MAG: cytochrome c [Acidobacteriota bacterium]